MASSSAFNPNGLSVIQPSMISSGFGGFLRNRVINGDCRISRRATSFATPASALYTLDQWLVIYDGTINAFTLSQQVMTPGSFSPETPNFLRWNQTAAGSGSTIRQVATKIEDVRQLAGQLAYLSFWAKADAGRNVVVSAQQNFGSGGSAAVPIAATSGGTAGLAAGWAQFTAVFTVPSVSGKTIGAGSNLEVFFSLPINTTMIIDITNVQLEVGGQTPFDFRPISQEALLCSRYYQKFPVYVPASPTVVSVNHAPTRTTAPTIAGGGAGVAITNQTDTGFDITQTAAATQTITVEDVL